MGLNSAFSKAAGGAGRFRSAMDQANASLGRIRQSSGTASTAVGAIKSSAGHATTAMNKVKAGTDKAHTSLGRLRTSANNGDKAVGTLRTGLNNANTAFGKAKGGTDKLKSSLDKLRGSADKAKKSLGDVKRQADSVEKSVGKAGKGADRTGKSMGGGLAKGLKGAGLAQKGLNLAMAASPFGLIMTLLAPLITRFVDMDKIVDMVSKGFKTGMSVIGKAVSAANRAVVPILKGLGNLMLAPFRGFANGMNVVIGALNGFKVNIPSWVPVFGGKSFTMNLPKIPVPHLAKGGLVQPRNGGTLAVIGEAGEHEAVIPLSRLERMLGAGGNRAQLARLTEAVERLADRPVHVQVDGQTIARAVIAGHRQLARR
ncbi:hypothetical protein [Streptomyces lichenis]|uniref:Phage tail protein n=1 Tax=Streptomyces lichenis TaxID=2306967 RepID=A0ABT0IG54_9ACTN|nr:hypothetical protein [Streptomyces lichenis]MCK8680317.1 hypothetical protein [Streptomyces lichenis]